MKYSVLIRTLGTAKDKYLQTLRACASQTIQPQKVYVALPVGYKTPKETLGIETFIYTPKGMVAQRAFAFEQIENVDWVLLLDDDVTFPSDFVEKLGIVASTENADVIVPSTSQQGHSVLKSVLIDFYNVLTLTRTKMFFEKEYLAKITAWGRLSENYSHVG